MTDPNIALMNTIRAKWGASIDAACALSSVKPEFLAALIANESGGNPDAADVSTMPTIDDSGNITPADPLQAGMSPAMILALGVGAWAVFDLLRG
jgi:hypothetical protein